MIKKSELILKLLDLIDVFHLFVKTYRAICFTKLTLDQIPSLNPYVWPFSFVRILTNPYFKVWLQILPNIRVGSGSYDISTIIAMEVLNRLQNMIFWIKILVIESIE